MYRYTAVRYGKNAHTVLNGPIFPAAKLCFSFFFPVLLFISVNRPYGICFTIILQLYNYSIIIASKIKNFSY